MKKQEALKLISDVVGYIPYPIIFEIYNDEDEIPDELIRLFCSHNQRSSSIIMYTSPRGHELFQEALLEDWRRK